MDAKGKTLIKVSSILLIIGAAIMIIVALIGMFSGGAVGILGGAMNMGDAGSAVAGLLGGTLMVLFGVVLVLGVFELICGIIGMKNADNPAGAGKIIGLGIAMIVLALIGAIFGSMVNTTWYSIVLSFILPILYTVGGFLNKSAA